LSEDPALRLSSQAKEDKVVPGQDSVHQLGHHRVVISDDAGKKLLSGPQFPDQVFAEFVLHGEGFLACGFELADGSGSRRRHRKNTLPRLGQDFPWGKPCRDASFWLR